MPSSPVRYSPSVEVLEQDEEDTDRQLVETLRGISEITYEDSGHALRSVHAKSHGLLHGELEVIAGLPPTLAQGLFSKPAKYPVVMRFSTIPGDVLDDSISVPRGLAVKIIGVPGDRLPGSEGDTTQDFVLVDGPAFAAPTAKKFLGNLKLLAKTTDKAEGLKKALSVALRGAEALLESVGSQSGLLKTLGGHPEDHILGETFFSQAPIRYGDYIAKVAVAPVRRNWSRWPTRRSMSTASRMACATQCGRSSPRAGRFGNCGCSCAPISKPCRWKIHRLPGRRIRAPMSRWRGLLRSGKTHGRT
jgi:hypothetical protein